MVEYFKGIGNLGPRDAGAFVAGLSVASTRGITASQEQLRKISDYTFWDGLPAPLSRQDRLQLYEAGIREMSCNVTFPELRKGLDFSGFNKAEQESLQKALAIADEVHREYIKADPLERERLPPWHKQRDLAGEASWLKDVNAPSVLPAERTAGTPKAATGDADIPETASDGSVMRVLSPGTALSVKMILNEGVGAFGQILEMLFADQHQSLIEQIMDNGRPVPEAKKKKDFEGFVNAIKAQKALLEDAKAKGLLKAEQYRDFQMELILDTRIERLPADDDTPVVGSDNVTLFFSLPDTSEVLKKHISKVGGTSAEKTVTRGGDIQVFMKRIDGKWYWNPVGW